MFLTAFVTAIAAYLMGSVNFAVIFIKAFTKKDVRESGSGNAGTTNALRVGGVVPGVLTFVCDVLKGVCASLLGLLIFSYIYKKTGSALYLPIYGAYICGVVVIIGHIFPLFFEFKGGKGVATGLGTFFVCCPLAAGIGIAVFAVMTFLTKIVSLSSIAATFFVVVFSLVFYTKDNGALFTVQAVCALFIGALIVLKHSSNIKRLLNGEEKRLKIKR